MRQWTVRYGISFKGSSDQPPIINFNQFKFQTMGVPGFYSWLTRRYPMIKQMISKQSIPQIDYLYLDMNGIIYKCVRDDSIIFKAQLMPKELEQIWIEIFNYINALVDMLKPTKMIVMALDGVAPRCKMNNQRARRFRSAQQYKQFINKFYGYTDIADSQENFKNNSISPGTAFMNQLNDMLHFFIQKKIEEDNYWKTLSVVFTGSDTPGEGEHKIMEFVRGNREQFHEDDTHCFYGADADLIMLGLTLPIKNACIIREEYIHTSDRVQIMSSRKQKQVNFELIYLTILKECFNVEYEPLREKMKVAYDINKIARDFVFLFFFIGNDFLPRIFAYNIRERSIEKLIEGFKDYLVSCQAYITDGEGLNLIELSRLLSEIGKFESSFFADKQMEFEKLLNKQQQNFEDELQKMFMTKIRHEEQTLQGLKQMYVNQDLAGKTNYYSSYFQIDINNQVGDLWNILAYYVYGLKFVFEYYFNNLASWSWYYPYYFAPLLTDIQYYIGNLIAQGQSLTAFEKGEPFEPFKQLLCILPKESADLLPPNFHSHIIDPQSELRNPTDFYPDNVETVTYGSIRAHQAISLIPFLDQSLICKVYDQEIVNTDPKQLGRNVLRPSRLYEYNLSAERSEIVSPFSTIKSLKCNIETRDVVLYQKFDWKARNNVQIVNEGEESLLKMPSLYMRPFEIKPLLSNRDQMQFKLILKQVENQNFKIGEQIFYGYPLEHSGRIEAVLTKNAFYCSPGIDLVSYDFINKEFRSMSATEAKQRPYIVFNAIKQNIARSEGGKYSFYNFIELSSSSTFLFLTQTKTFSRTIEGEFQRLFKDNNHESFAIIPACVASRQKKYQTTKTITKFKSIEIEFPINEEVLLTHPQKTLCGAKGKVIGYTNDHKKVKVQILQEPRYLQGEIKELVNLLSTKTDIFFSLRFSAEILRMKYDHLQTILGNINIVTPKGSKLPPSIDIGLNLFSRKEKKIVPNLIRINFEYNGEEKKANPFKYIELSVRALEILIQYKKNFPEIFKFMEERHLRLIEKSKMSDKQKIDWDEPIEAEAIYPESPAKSLMRVYKWLVEKEETHMPASSIYSKQVNQKRIQKLNDLFVALRNNKEERQRRNANKRKHIQQKIEIIDPNFLFSQKLSQLGYLYLMKKPKNHQIGDLVICVSPQFFSHYGAIVGIDDNKYEVFFDQPSFGKGDLGGLCDNLWGAKFDFRELLNIYTWPSLFSERVKGSSQHERLGWNDNVEYFYPKYVSKPFQDFQDIKVFTAKEQNKKYFNEQFLSYIFSVQQNLKQTDLQQGFSVVDNRKEDYRYKYSKKVAYIEKTQVDEAAEVIKAMEETTEVLLKAEAIKVKEEEIFKQVSEQIIENRAGEQEKTEGGEIGQQQDAQDILG